MSQVQITFRDMEPSPFVEAEVRAKAERLQAYFPWPIRCRVMLEQPHRRHRKGGHFHVRIDLSVPGAELVVGRDPAKDGAHEDFHIALRDAFRAARRELQDYARTRRGDVKQHIANV